MLLLLKKHAHVRFLPRGRSQQDLPVVATTVDEDVTGGAVRAGSAEAFGGVALLQRALVLLHGQTVIGQTQLFVGRLRVQLERLTWKRKKKPIRIVELLTVKLLKQNSDMTVFTLKKVFLGIIFQYLTNKTQLG